MRAQTLVQMRTDAQERADMETDTHVTDAMWNRWINQGLQRVFRRLVKSAPERYYASTDIVTTEGTASYDVPADFVAPVGVDLIISATEHIQIDTFNLNERRGPARLGGVSNDAPPTRYQIRGTGDDTQIYFDPDPGSRTYRLHYTYNAPELTADDDTFDGVAGFEDSIIEYAVWKAQRRSEDDTADTQIALADADQGIDSINSRDLGRPPRIADVRRMTRRRGWRTR